MYDGQIFCLIRKLATGTEGDVLGPGFENLAPSDAANVVCPVLGKL